jgi:hypothetical protein
VADRLSEIDDLVDRADLDELVRLVDRVCRDGDWPALLELRNRSRAAVATGRQLWPVATLAEYRLALWAPAEWATQVLDEDSGRFTIGPLTEVVAQRHSFDDLRPLLPDGPRVGFIAHERALRGEPVAADVPNPLEIPFTLGPWEPEYCLASYGDDGIDAPSPRLPEPTEFVPVDDVAAGTVIDDPDVTLAVRQLVEPWTSSSNGRVSIVAVEGDVGFAVGALGLDDAAIARITTERAMAWMGWAGASGGAHGRRRGAAIGRFGAWWTVAAVAGLLDDWPVDPNDIGDALADLEWYWWSTGAPTVGWELQLAVADPAEGCAWAMSAHDVP